MQVSFDDYALAAAVATELVNTAPGVWNGTDQLPDAGALASFLGDHVAPHWIPDPAEDPPTEADVHATHLLRGSLREIIESGDQRQVIDRAAMLTGVVGNLTLATDDDRTRWQATCDPRAPLADRLGLLTGVGILGVLHTLGLERFRVCASPTCSGAFIDTTRNGARRYCMPGLCGNRVNVANHRARRREQ